MQTGMEKGKQAAATLAADWIEEGKRVGLGTGSTTAYFIKALGVRCQSGLKIKAVATSRQSETLAKKEKIPLIDINTLQELDIAVDGCDEIDRNKRMIKGGGGALLREKIIAAMSQEFVVIADSSKRVERLGAFPLPLEISTFGWTGTIERIQRAGFSGVLRCNKMNPFVTDNGNYIVDLQISKSLMEPEEMDLKLKKIPGVLETGFFLSLAGRVVIGYGDGKVEVLL